MKCESGRRGRISVAISVLVIAAYATGHATAQIAWDPFAGTARDTRWEVESTLQIMVDAIGRTTLLVCKSMRPSFVPDALEVLRSPRLVRAVEIVDRQKVRLDELQRKIEFATAQMLRTSGSAKVTMDKVSVQREVDAVLLPHQVKRIERIRQRYAFLVGGIQQVSHGLSDAARRTFEDEWERCRQSTRSRVTVETAAILNELEAMLDAGQRQRLAAYLSLRPQLVRLPIEMWLWHLGDDACPTPREHATIAAMMAVFRLDADGSLLWQDFGASGQTVELLLEDLRSAEYVGRGTDFQPVLSSQVLEFLQLDAPDRLVVSTLESRRNTVAARLIAGELSYDEASDEMEKVIRDAEKWKFERLERVLLPDQLEALRILAQQREVVLTGMFKAILHGHLKLRADLTADQAAQVDALRRGSAIRLDKLSRDLEKECIESFRAWLPLAVRDKLVPLMDFDSNLLPGAPELLMQERQFR